MYFEELKKHLLRKHDMVVIEREDNYSISFTVTNKCFKSTSMFTTSIVFLRIWTVRKICGRNVLQTNITGCALRKRITPNANSSFP